MNETRSFPLMVSAIDNRHHAKELAALGFWVFPLVFRGKNPVTEHGHKEATLDPAEIDRLWSGRVTCNIGIATGPSRLIVIDLDIKKGAKGEESWAALVAEHGETDTYTVKTWSGGRHLYFWAREGVEIRNSQGKLGDGIDVRAEGGFVVAPPSVIREGDAHGRYEVDEDWPIEDCPDWLLERLIALARKPEPREQTGVVASSSEAEARVRELSNELAMIPVGHPGEGAVNTNSFMVGQYVGAGQIAREDAERIMLDGIAGWTWDRPGDYEKFCDKIIRSISDGMRSPRAWEAQIVQPVVGESAATSDAKQVDSAEDALRDVTDWSTNIGQAQHLHKFMDHRLIHVDGVGWFVWNVNVWNAVSQDYVLSLMSTFYRKQFQAMVSKYRETMQEKYQALAKQYKKFMNTSQQSAILKALSVTEGVFTNADELDADKELLNTPGGVVNLRTGETVTHDPKFMMTKITSGSYKPGYKHPDWEKALTGLSEESADYMQLRLGQAITGYTPEDALFMIGHGKNSKSLLLSDGTARAAGGYAAMSGPALISTGQDASAANPDKAGLRGVRLAYIEELPEAGSLSVAELKRVVETSTIKARFLHANPFEFDATHSLFVTSNYDPAVNQTDDGTWRRLCLVRFKIKFVAKPEGQHERLADPGLKRRVREGRQGQHDAIVTWLVEGAMRYFGNEAMIGEEHRPLEVAEGTQDWRMKADRIMAYYSERLVVDHASGVARNDLYADFCNFLAEHGHTKWSLETFASRFGGHELTVRAGVTTARISGSKVEALSRPMAAGTVYDSTIGRMPKQPWVYLGLRFKKDEDTSAEENS